MCKMEPVLPSEVSVLLQETAAEDFGPALRRLFRSALGESTETQPPAQALLLLRSCLSSRQVLSKWLQATSTEEIHQTVELAIAETRKESREPNDVHKNVRAALLELFSFGDDEEDDTDMSEEAKTVGARERDTASTDNMEQTRSRVSSPGSGSSERRSAAESEGGPELAQDWVAAALAAALPLLHDVLPRDPQGACIVPHPHPMVMHTCPEHKKGFSETGLLMYETGRACDNCDGPIIERHFWRCSAGCSVDFCRTCHEATELLLAGRDLDHVQWVVRFVTRAARHILLLTLPAQRNSLVHHLALHWPSQMFEQLVEVAVGVADASVVHIEDNAQIDQYPDFWHTVGLLQLLYAANRVPRPEASVFLSSAKLSPEHFILKGINKCESYSDWVRWCREGERDECMHEEVVRRPFQLSSRFTCFLAHCNLVPLAFRQQCVQQDVRAGVSQFRRIQVHREPQDLLRADCLQALGHGFARRCPVQLHGLQASAALNGQVGVLYKFDAGSERWEVVLQNGDKKSVKASNIAHYSADGRCSADLRAEYLGQGLDAMFEGEPGRGPGVTREFMRLALQALLLQDTAAPAWDYDEDVRTYWFNESKDVPAAAFRATGALLGHAILMDTPLAPAFPEPVYSLLLRGLGAANVGLWTLEDLAKVSPSMASGLEELIDYAGDDAADVFPLDWPRAPEIADIAAEGRAERRAERQAEYVQGYVEWYFTERFAMQAGALVEGFRAVVGQSEVIRRLVTAPQLEAMVCGAALPMNVAAVRSRAATNGWREDEQPYLDDFWRILLALSDADRRRFAMFVSASTHMPVKGWSDFRLQVQKNGSGDERLPTAYTCFNLLLLPVYTSPQVLEQRLLQAISETQGFGLS